MTGSTQTESERLTVTVEEAAAVLRIGRQSAYQAARTGELPTVRLGRRLLVPRARLLELLGESSELSPNADETATDGSVRKPPVARVEVSTG